MENYGLYTWDKKTYYNISDDRFQYRFFKPSIVRPLFFLMCGMQGPYRKSECIFDEIRWALGSAFQYRIYYILAENKIIHTSYVIKKSFKFPFLKKNDFQIGPCVTVRTHRGKGLYPSMISFIIQNEHKEKSGGGNTYMIIRDRNLPSINGVKTAGFYKCANLKKSKWLKIYKINKGEEVL